MITVTFYDSADKVAHQLTTMNEVITAFALASNTSERAFAATITNYYTFTYNDVEYQLSKFGLDNKTDTITIKFDEA